MLGNNLLCVKDFLECLDDALHSRRYIRYTGSNLRMAVITLLSAIIKCYFTAVNIDMKNRVKSAEKEIKNVVSELNNDINDVITS